MKVSPRSYMWILFTIAVLGLFSCKSSMHSKSVFGGKKGNLKAVFQRYQSRDFKAKKENKKIQNKITHEKEGNENDRHVNVTKSPDPKPNTTTIENTQLTEPEGNLNSLTIPDDVPNTNVTEESSTEVITNELVTEGAYSENITADEVLSASINTTKNASIKAIKNIAKKTSSAGKKEVLAETSSSNFISLSGIYKKFYNGDFRTELKEMKINAEKKGKSYLWVLYFAIAQAFTAMFLGFKNIFQMLDTPFDAGNKALGISYAAIAILTIHTLLLVGLVKNFM